MKNINVNDWVKLHKDLRVGVPKESTEYQVGKVFDNGDIWVLTPQFAQPFGYDGERVSAKQVSHIRNAVK